jgi:membrane fusion protein, multidrug efflux system
MRRSYLIAGAIAILAAGWLASGMLTRHDGGEATVTPTPQASAAPLADDAPEVVSDQAGGIVEPTGAPVSPAPTETGGIVSVQVMDSLASPQSRTIVLRGRAEADNVVEIRAETYGRVTKTPAEKGTIVHVGDKLAIIDPSDRAARLAEAKALRQQRKAESDAAKRLAEKGFAPKLNLTELAANLALAEAQVAAMEIEISHLSIESPIEGVLDVRAIEVGSYLQVADPVATIIDLDPIVLVGYATERDVGQLDIGGAANARLLDGRQVTGKLRFISSRAEQETRTFRIEVEVPNADYAIRDGLSAELVIPVDAVPAHRISPAILTLGPSGEVGVKLVDETNKVRFTPVEILREDPTGLWIVGPAEKARMIVVGQDFVLDGQLVRPVESPTGEAPTAPATTTP